MINLTTNLIYVINHKSDKLSGQKVKIISQIDDDHFWVKPENYDLFKSLESKKDEDNQLIVVSKKFLSALN